MYGRTCYQPRCYGVVYSLYTRLGTPPKWTKAGTLCKRCGHFIPEPTFIEGQQLPAFS